jgi:hypothetical protein
MAAAAAIETMDGRDCDPHGEAVSPHAQRGFETFHDDAKDGCGRARARTTARLLTSLLIDQRPKKMMMLLLRSHASMPPPRLPLPPLLDPLDLQGLLRRS